MSRFIAVVTVLAFLAMVAISLASSAPTLINDLGGNPTDSAQNSLSPKFQYWAIIAVGVLLAACLVGVVVASIVRDVRQYRFTVRLIDRARENLLAHGIAAPSDAEVNKEMAAITLREAGKSPA